MPGSTRDERHVVASAAIVVLEHLIEARIDAAGVRARRAGRAGGRPDHYPSAFACQDRGGSVDVVDVADAVVVPRFRIGDFRAKPHIPRQRVIDAEIRLEGHRSLEALGGPGTSRAVVSESAALAVPPRKRAIVAASAKNCGNESSSCGLLIGTLRTFGMSRRTPALTVSRLVGCHRSCRKNEYRQPT